MFSALRLSLFTQIFRFILPLKRAIPNLDLNISGYTCTMYNRWPDGFLRINPGFLGALESENRWICPGS
jgi:hypothetical protein